MRWMVACVALALASTPVASAGLPTNACALLTNTEVAKLLGSKVVDREASGTRRLLSCEWTGASLGGAFAVQRMLMVQVGRTTKTQFDQTARRTPGAVRVRGVGEVAFVVMAGGGALLTVYAHGYLLQLNDAYVTASLGVEKAAAKLALTRL